MVNESTTSPADNKRRVPKFVTALLIAVFVAIVTPLGVYVVNNIVVPAVDNARQPPPAPAQPFQTSVTLYPGQDYALPEVLNTQAEYGPLVAGDYDNGLDLGSFAYENGGAPTGTLVAKVVITALDRYPVTILNIEPVQLARAEPFMGTHLIMSESGTGGGGDIALLLHLDAPGVGFTSGSDEPYFATHHTPVTSAEPAYFSLTFDAREASHSWLLKITYLDWDGEQRSATLDRAGALYDMEKPPDPAPFALTAEVDQYLISFTRRWLTNAPGYELSHH